MLQLDIISLRYNYFLLCGEVSCFPIVFPYYVGPLFATLLCIEPLFASLLCGAISCFPIMLSNLMSLCCVDPLSISP